MVKRHWFLKYHFGSEIWEKKKYIYGKKEKIKYTIGKTNMMNKWLHDERHFISIGYFKIDNLHLVRLAKRNKYDKVTRDKKTPKEPFIVFVEREIKLSINILD